MNDIWFTLTKFVSSFLMLVMLLKNYSGQSLTPISLRVFIYMLKKLFQ